MSNGQIAAMQRPRCCWGGWPSVRIPRSQAPGTSELTSSAVSMQTSGSIALIRRRRKMSLRFMVKGGRTSQARKLDLFRKAKYGGELAHNESGVIREFMVSALALVLGLNTFGAERPVSARSISSDEKLAQLLVVGFDGTTPNADLKRLVSEWHVGGIALYAQNVESPTQVARLNTAIHEMAGDGPPPFIAVDQEGGS